MKQISMTVVSAALIFGLACSTNDPAAPKDRGPTSVDAADAPAEDVPMTMSDGQADDGSLARGDATANEMSTTDAGAESGVLVPGLVCNGMASECPAIRPENMSSCSKAALCCVYQHPGVVVGGCTCYLNRWVCLDQQCGCPGAP